jgi:hypothetical protein
LGKPAANDAGSRFLLRAARRPPAPETRSMGDVVNLNRHRKAVARQQREKEAAENRVRFGRKGADTARDRQERERQARDLDGKQHDDSP